MAKKIAISDRLPWRVVELLKENRKTIEEVHGEDMYRQALAGELTPHQTRLLSVEPDKPLLQR